MDEKRAELLETLEKKLQYKFQNLSLLDTALTHASYVKGDGRACAHNERLEFLGDAVVELCVSEHLYKNYPDMDEGHMTRARALAVYERALHQIALSLGLGEALLLSRGEERSGGREKPSILADAMEAVIGAVFLDGGLSSAAELILRYSAKSISEAATGVTGKDYKTMLQEYVQKQHLGMVNYVFTGANGPDHKKVFYMRVEIGSVAMGEGEGGSKQEAGQRAAKMALEKLTVAT